MKSALLVREMRVSRGLTQEQLGDRIGVGQAQIGRWESHANGIRHDTLERIAKELGYEITLLQREDYEERAAIMEYDGGLSRSDAERKAAELVLWKRSAR